TPTRRDRLQPRECDRASELPEMRRGFLPLTWGFCVSAYRLRVRDFSPRPTDFPGKRSGWARRTRGSPPIARCCSRDREGSSMKTQLIALGVMAALSLTTTALAGPAAPKTPAAATATHTPMTPQQTQTLWQSAQTKLKAAHLYNGPV